MPRVLRGRCAGGAHDDRDGRDHWIPAVSAEATPTASSPNAVAESIQHSQQSKSPRLRVSAGIAGIARIACRSRPRPRRLRLRGVDGRRHPAGGIRTGHPTVNRREHAHQPAEPQRRRRGCRAVCAAIRGQWARRGRWQFPHHRLQVVTPSCATWRGLRPVAVPRGGGYDLAAGDTTCRGPTRRGLRPRGGSCTSLRDAHRPPRVGVSPATRPDREQVPHSNHPATPGRTHQPSR